MEAVALVARFVLGVLFVLAGLAKVPRRREFADVVGRYALLPVSLVSPVARALPIAELIAGSALLLGLGTRVVAALLGLLLVAFTIAVASALAGGRELDCGCFSAVAPQRITWRTVARNVALLGLAALVVLERPVALGVDSLGSEGPRLAAADAFAILIATTTGLAAVAIARAGLRVRRLAVPHSGARG